MTQERPSKLHNELTYLSNWLWYLLESLHSQFNYDNRLGQFPNPLISTTETLFKPILTHFLNNEKQLLKYNLRDWDTRVIEEWFSKSLHDGFDLESSSLALEINCKICTK